MKRRFSIGRSAGMKLGLAIAAGLLVAGCRSADITGPSAADIHNQFPEHHGGWLMVTNNTGATR